LRERRDREYDRAVATNVPSRSFLARVAGSITIQLLLFAAAVVVYNRAGRALHVPSGRNDFSDGAAPLYAFRQPVPPLTGAVLLRWAAPVAVVAVWLALVLRSLQGPRPARPLVRVGVAFVLAMNLTTAMMDDGVRSITWPFARSGEESYGDAARLSDPARLLRDYPTLPLSRHARTHPPGGVLFLWLVRKVLGEGLMAASLAAVVATALAVVPAVAIARRFLPEAGVAIFVALYVVAPNLVLFGATSMDGVFALFLLTCAWAFFRATQANDANPVLHGLHVGVWLAIATFFTWAAAALVALFIAWWAGEVLWHTGRGRRVAVVLGVAGVTVIASGGLLYLTTGCDLVACLKASLAFDGSMMREVRAAYADTSITNLLGFLVGSGAIAATLATRSIGCGRDAEPASRLTTTLAVTVVLLSFSTLFSRELERVWMFLTPLLLIGAAAALDRLPEPRRTRWVVASMALLFVQTACTQVFLYTMW
jgi:hypothetical protein